MGVTNYGPIGRVILFKRNVKGEVEIGSGNKTKKVEDQYSANALSPSETPESASTVSSTNTNVPQNIPGVNAQSMQNAPRLSFTDDFEAGVIQRFGITKMNDYIHVHSIVLTNENADGRPEDVQGNETRAKLPSAMETVYSGGEDLSSTSLNDEYEPDGIFLQNEKSREQIRVESHTLIVRLRRAAPRAVRHGRNSE